MTSGAPVRRYVQKLADAYRRGGVRSAAAAPFRSLIWKLWRDPKDLALDGELPQSTAEKVQPEDLGATGPNVASAVEYAPTPRVVFDWALGDLPASLERFVFVDLGSGKGRVLLLAARHRFKAVVGVEFSPELHRVAAANIAHLGLQDRVTSVQADAVDFTIPDDPGVFYFYNPFGESVLRGVIENIVRSYADRPRPMYVIYLNPVHAEVLETCARLQPVRRPLLSRLKHVALSEHDLRIYRLGGPQGGE